MRTPIHDFAARLSDPRVLTTVVGSVDALRAHIEGSGPATGAPGPISINLDLTTACNYACDHCIDAGVLNDGRRLALGDVLSTLRNLTDRGLRSVILIGGGEPTLHRHFEPVLLEIKALGLECGIVTNGSNNGMLARLADAFTPNDWIRLSLDAADDATFRAMHRPRSARTLDEIYAGAGAIKRANPAVSLGLSFIVSWRGLFVTAQRSGELVELRDNVDEIAAAASLAKGHGFDYVSYKPMLSRDVEGHEVIRMPGGPAGDRLRARIEDQLARARAIEDDTFAIHASLNLAAVTTADSHLTSQPKRCYMHLFRQVVTPSGIYGCPAYRGADIDRIADGEAYATSSGCDDAIARTHELIDRFDVSVECREIECIYNSVNWWLDGVYTGAEVPVPQRAERGLFL
jgi:Radical SAM superfamily